MMSRKAPRRRRRRLLLAYVLPFLLIEGSMRWTGLCGQLPRGMERDSSVPGLPYELAPGARLEWEGFCIPMPKSEIRISSQGLRDREYASSKPEGVKRIAALGDSVAFGLGVDEERAFLPLWENGVNEAGRKVEVINFAVPGYGLGEYRIVARDRAPEFHPDEVWIFLISNDLRESRDWGAVGRIIKLPMLVSQAARGVFFLSAFASEVVREGVAPEVFHSMEYVRESFDDLDRTATANAWPVTVVWAERPRRFVGRVKEEAERRGFRFLDGGEWISQWPGREVELPDRHFNAAGHARFADFLIRNTP